MIQYSEESLESRWYREHSIRIHMKRLKDIKGRASSIVQSPVRFNSVNRSRLGKPTFKHFEMVKQNIMLYDKLTHISERRHNKSEIKGPKSLNISIRKKEADRIIQDNFEFVKRLTERESMFSVTKLKREYDMQEKYKVSISKHNLHERLKKITESELKLPPIFQESGGKGSSTSRVSQGSKGNSKTKLKNSRNHSEESSIKDTPKQKKNGIKQKVIKLEDSLENTEKIAEKNEFFESKAEEIKEPSITPKLSLELQPEDTESKLIPAETENEIPENEEKINIDPPESPEAINP